MNLSNYDREEFLKECRISLQSLFSQTVYVFIGLIMVLLATGGNPSSWVLMVSFVFGIFFVAWVEQRRIRIYRGEIEPINNRDKVNPKTIKSLGGLKYLATKTAFATARKKNKGIRNEMFELNDMNSLQSNISIRIIGDRASGKTTYLTSLACYSKLKTSNLIQDIIPTNSEASSLVGKTLHVLMEGGQIEPTIFPRNYLELPDYSLRLMLKNRGNSIYPVIRRKRKFIDLSFKEYAGEFLKDILYMDDFPFIREYIEDASKANGIILTFDGSSHSLDSKYIDVLLNSLKSSKFDRHERFRIAVAVTKCEIPPISMMSKNPRAFMRKNFLSIYEALERHCKSNFFEVEYFSTSAFGLLDHSLEPNSTLLNDNHNTYGTSAVIRNPLQWKPIGVIAPVYWLATGQYRQES
jgi:hypothetical protein